MENKFKDFYDLLRENLDSYRGEYERFIDYGPDLFKLLIDILNDKNIGSHIRIKINAALAYYVAPFDIIPEQIYGPHGYIDDIYVCAYVIKDIGGELGYDYLETMWEGDESLEIVVDECYIKSEEILEDKVDEVLGYVGLK
jgi:uncharacterized membrane protein YkvA (DUF1232 family)